MILNCQERGGEDCFRYRVVDAETGEIIREPIWYADDEAGVYRVYEYDETAYDEANPGPRPRAKRLRCNEDGSVAWREVRRAIKIVPKARAAVRV